VHLGGKEEKEVKEETGNSAVRPTNAKKSSSISKKRKQPLEGTSASPPVAGHARASGVPRAGTSGTASPSGTSVEADELNGSSSRDSRKSAVSSSIHSVSRQQLVEAFRWFSLQNLINFVEKTEFSGCSISRSNRILQLLEAKWLSALAELMHHWSDHDADATVDHTNILSMAPDERGVRDQTQQRARSRQLLSFDGFGKTAAESLLGRLVTSPFSDPYTISPTSRAVAAAAVSRRTSEIPGPNATALDPSLVNMFLLQQSYCWPQSFLLFRAVLSQFRSRGVDVDNYMFVHPLQRASRNEVVIGSSSTSRSSIGAGESGGGGVAPPLPLHSSASSASKTRKRRRLDATCPVTVEIKYFHSGPQRSGGGSSGGGSGPSRSATASGTSSSSNKPRRSRPSTSSTKKDNPISAAAASGSIEVPPVMGAGDPDIDGDGEEEQPACKRRNVNTADEINPSDLTTMREKEKQGEGESSAAAAAGAAVDMIDWHLAEDDIIICTQHAFRDPFFKNTERWLHKIQPQVNRQIRSAADAQQRFVELGATGWMQERLQDPKMIAHIEKLKRSVAPRIQSQQHGLEIASTDSSSK